MSKPKKLLGLLLALTLVLNTLAIGVSAELGDGNQLSANLTLQVGKLSGTTFTPLTANDTLKVNDVITVRICPQTDFLVGSSYYVVMFDKTYFKVVGANKAAFTANTANTFYDQTADGYAGSTNIPSTSWPASFGATENYNVYTAIKVGNLADSNSNNGGYPSLIPGDWLFLFKLTVQKDIPAGTCARIWMDSRWFRSPGNPSADAYFAKCNDGDASSSGQSTVYNFNIDATIADLKLPLRDGIIYPSGYTVHYVVDGNYYRDVTIPAGSEVPTDPSVIMPEIAAPTKPGYTLVGWGVSPMMIMPEHDIVVGAIWQIKQITITFNSAGGTAVAPVTGNYGTAIPAVNPPTKIGYTFQGWSPTIPATFPAENITLTALWQINTYNAIFKVNGNIYQTVPTVYGAQIIAPANPVRSGYTFTGWSPSVGTIGAGDMIFNAMFNLNISGYIVHYVVDGNYYRDVTVSAGNEIPLDPSVVMPEMAAPTKPGYTLVGWGVSPMEIMPEHDIFVSAIWESNSTLISVGFANPYYGGTAPITVTVNGRPSKIQIVSAATGMTNTYDRRTSPQIISIQGYDKDGNIVSTLSSTLSYEKWVINVKLAAGDYTARAKYLSTWNSPQDDRPFTVVLS
jgi:hypothetical protein